MRPRPLCTEAYLDQVSKELRTAYNSASQRIAWKPDFLGPAATIAGLLGLIGFLLWLPSIAPKFGREVIDSTTHWRNQSDAPELRRATLVKLPVGYHYQAVLPDGTCVWTTYKGAVDSFSDLPLYPRLGDQWVVRQSSAQGWIWMVPPPTLAPQYYLGHAQYVPTWVDP